MTSLRAANDRDLLVIGAGVLGGMLIEQHKAMYPDATIIAETRTTDKHSALKAKGATCRTVDDPPIEAQPNVVFCAAPGANPDYPGEVNKALERWSGAGKFVFTSSGGVYAEEDGQVVNEESVVSDGPRAQKLLSCEKLVLDKGGSVVRLAGLYTLDRGAHNYWCKVGTVDARPDGLIGLVSYEDAAGSALSVLSCDKSKVAGKVFLICDGKEQSREDICKAALGCQFYEDSKMPAFTKSDGPIGKRYDISRATSVLVYFGLPAPPSLPLLLSVSSPPPHPQARSPSSPSLGTCIPDALK